MHIQPSIFHDQISTIFCVMTERKSAKEIFPVPSLSTSPIIFLISSFFGSNPRALIATWHSGRQRCESDAHIQRKHMIVISIQALLLYLELLDIDESGSIGVKQLKGLPDLLLLLLSQLWFGGGLLARRWYRTLQGWSLGTGRLVGVGIQEGEVEG